MHADAGPPERPFGLTPDGGIHIHPRSAAHGFWSRQDLRYERHSSGYAEFGACEAWKEFGASQVLAGWPYRWSRPSH